MVSLDDNITQEQLNLYFSQVNSIISTIEKKYFTPYGKALKKYGTNFLKTVGIVKIRSTNTNLNK